MKSWKLAGSHHPCYRHVGDGVFYQNRDWIFSLVKTE